MLLNHFTIGVSPQITGLLGILLQKAQLVDVLGQRHAANFHHRPEQVFEQAVVHGIEFARLSPPVHPPGFPARAAGSGAGNRPASWSSCSSDWRTSRKSTWWSVYPKSSASHAAQPGFLQATVEAVEQVGPADEQAEDVGLALVGRGNRGCDWQEELRWSGAGVDQSASAAGAYSEPGSARR